MNTQHETAEYMNCIDVNPLFLVGNAVSILSQIDSSSIDCCITSPPYWGQRKYENGGIGLECKPEEYVSNLLSITSEIKRILKPTGSFWLNIGDTYQDKSLAGIPWRTALQMTDKQHWTLRNSII